MENTQLEIVWIQSKGKRLNQLLDLTFGISVENLVLQTFLCQFNILKLFC